MLENTQITKNKHIMGFAENMGDLLKFNLDLQKPRKQKRYFNQHLEYVGKDRQQKPSKSTPIISKKMQVQVRQDIERRIVEEQISHWIRFIVVALIFIFWCWVCSGLYRV